jgi:hypothetical protein
MHDCNQRARVTYSQRLIGDMLVIDGAEWRLDYAALPARLLEDRRARNSLGD